MIGRPLTASNYSQAPLSALWGCRGLAPFANAIGATSATSRRCKRPPAGARFVVEDARRNSAAIRPSPFAPCRADARRFVPVAPVENGTANGLREVVR